MTTKAEVADQPRLELGTFNWRRAAVWFIVTMLAIVFFAAAFAAGYGRFHEGRVLPGVDVAGVDVAGLNRAAAEAKLRRALPDLGAGALTVNVDGSESEVAYSEIARDYDMELMLDEAFGVGRTGVTSEQLQEQMRTLLNGLSIGTTVNFDAEELAARVAGITTATESEPVDATITRVGSEYVVTPSQEGSAVD